MKIQTSKGDIDTDWMRDAEYKRALILGIQKMATDGELDHHFAPQNDPPKERKQ